MSTSILARHRLQMPLVPLAMYFLVVCEFLKIRGPQSTTQGLPTAYICIPTSVGFQKSRTEVEVGGVCSLSPEQKYTPLQERPNSTSVYRLATYTNTITLSKSSIVVDSRRMGNN